MLHCDLRVLCLSSDRTAQAVSQCELVKEVTQVNSASEAQAAIASEPFHVLVAALGKRPESYLIHKTKSRNHNERPSFKSRVLHDARRYNSGMLRVVYSSTAYNNQATMNLCMQCGADVVVSTNKELEKALHLYFSASSESIDTETTARPPTTTKIQTTVLARRNAMEKQLLQISSDVPTIRFRDSQHWTSRAEKQISAANDILLSLTNRPSAAQTPSNNLRVVHVSDTHGKHWSLKQNLPSGDLFLHTGDFCANYHHQANLAEHLRDFLQWIEKDVCPKSEKVVFIAGNHDVLLDPKEPRWDKKADDMLQTFLKAHSPKVSYLCDSSTVFRGVTIYGSPTCVSRMETKNKRYLSNGFERRAVDRIEIWKKIPVNVDILMTHCPPCVTPDDPSLENICCGPEDRGTCRFLGREVYQNSMPNSAKRAPLLHAFGHCHDTVGIGVYQNTILSNGSQGKLLEMDNHGGGLPFVVDLVMPAKETAVPS